MSKTPKVLANIIIMIVLMMMIRPHLPQNSNLLKTLYLPIIIIEDSIGTNQTWQMFSPNPSKLDAFVIGEVVYEDGSKDSFDFYGNRKLSMLQKYLYGEKYRKFTSEHLRVDRKSFLWEDGARFVVKKLEKKNYEKKPVQVSLTRYWNETPHWRRVFLKHTDHKQYYHNYIFYKKESW